MPWLAFMALEQPRRCCTPPINAHAASLPVATLPHQAADAKRIKPEGSPISSGGGAAAAAAGSGSRPPTGLASSSGARRTPPPSSARAAAAPQPPGAAPAPAAQLQQSSAQPAQAAAAPAPSASASAAATAPGSGLPSEEEIRAVLSQGPLPIARLTVVFKGRIVSDGDKQQFKRRMLRVGRIVQGSSPPQIELKP